MKYKADPNLENSAVAIGEDSFHSNPKKGNTKECSNYNTIALISHASNVILNIIQVRSQQYMTKNFQMYKLDLENTEEPEIKSPTCLVP